MISVALLIVSLATLVLCAPTAYESKLHESRTDIPASFSLTGAAPPDTPLPLRIALVPNTFPALEERLCDVSKPSRANYGKHLSKKEARPSHRVTFPSSGTQPYSSSAGRTTHQLQLVLRRLRTDLGRHGKRC